MGIITISLNHETERKLRQVLIKDNVIRKGLIGKAITEAVEEWISKKKQNEIAERQIALSKKGFNLGRYKFNRDELYD